MITEYVYENQEYENVLVKIKAALMDIISSEENKLYEIEQKITTTTDEDFKEKLSKLCADERSALRQIIITMNTLSASLEKVDSYSKDLDSIEDENIKEIIADLKNGNVNNISDSINSHVYQQEATIESVNQDPDVVREIKDYTDSNEEPVVEERIEQVPEESTPQVEPTEVQEETIESAQEEPIMAQEKEEVVEPVEQAEENVATEEIEEPVTEENVEETYPTEEQEETIENAAQEPVMTEEVPIEEQSTPAIEEQVEPIEQNADNSTDVEETPVEEQIESTEPIINTEEVIPEVSQEVKNEEQVYEKQPIETPADNTELVQEEPEDTTVYEEQQEVQEPQIEQEDEENQEEVASEQPSEQVSQGENTPLIPISTEETEQQQPSEETEEQVSPEITEEGVVAPPSITTDTQQQEEFAPSIPAIENQEEVASEHPSEQVSQGENTPLIPIATEETEQQQPSEETEEQVSPEITEEGVVAPPSITTDTQQQEEFAPSIPAIENQEEVTYQEDLKKEPLMTFIKASQDPPKAILTSLKQVTNLRMSYQTQNALLSSRGTIASRNVNGVDSEVQELVDNGLLAPSPENIEAMMNEANKLYQEGKINEAQEMYDQISVLNKQLQGSNAVVK